MPKYNNPIKTWEYSANGNISPAEYENNYYEMSA